MCDTSLLRSGTLSHAIAMMLLADEVICWMWLLTLMLMFVAVCRSVSLYWVKVFLFFNAALHTDSRNSLLRVPIVLVDYQCSRLPVHWTRLTMCRSFPLMCPLRCACSGHCLLMHCARQLIDPYWTIAPVMLGHLFAWHPLAISPLPMRAVVRPALFCSCACADSTLAPCRLRSRCCGCGASG